MDLQEIFRKFLQWDVQQLITFLGGSEAHIHPSHLTSGASPHSSPGRGLTDV